MRFLNGGELADFIKERQAHQVRALRQHDKILPRLAIVITKDDPVIETYVRIKKTYGKDILVDVDIHRVSMADLAGKIEELNNDSSVIANVLQLPLSDPEKTDEFVAKIAPQKDVDGLGPQADFDSATAVAINWLLTGYNIDLKQKKITIVGQGRLVGKPLAQMWRNSGLDVTVVDSTTVDMKSILLSSDIIVSAAGVPNLISGDMVPPAAVVVDAGTASEGAKIVGDVADEIYEREDITITPRRGGVGPLTVAALFDGVIQAAQKLAQTKA
ncbi:MAG: bifunctional 5,10-methylenetetrahydrofolate dehydrogenase/5,10-methenyltetrahydrofolate cyclohydrolase [Candidatus Nomurabacteria bacterium]|jgi:methylenetetrahydrofolate dehydrogenase (NADP+)/methenyltetrahydrofolate cyclohydrolase|nr:bifunctional 5,10-methylenetetrahydrofolate dehydrogenase/5,10-methenyltetrahydrofolate cyclohydrolase [Candidatus Nomurabacteria bacterium]